MRWGRRHTADRHPSGPVIGVVVPAYDVADYLPACLDSLLAQTHPLLDVVVVDDGSPDACGDIAESYAARDPRVRVVHTPNRGLGAARNEGVRHVGGDYLAFLDSDDVLPPTAYDVLLGSLTRSGSDFATGSVEQWWTSGPADTAGRREELPWLRRLHTPPREGVRIADHPEVLGDVFAWNKLYRRAWWDAEGLSWPEGVRYEDQPTTTEAFLRGRFDVLGEVVYRWRVRGDGSSITQQRSSLRDLEDRFATKRMALASVRAHGDPAVLEVFEDRVLPGDLRRYFAEIPGCSDEWWALLRDGVRDLWGERSLVHARLTPVHRLTGWLVEQDRREDAALVVSHAASLGRPLDRVREPWGVRVDVPGLDPATVDPVAMGLRPGEA